MEWGNCKVLVTGGASFIGTNLIQKLLALGARVTVIDNLSSGKFENIQKYVHTGAICFVKGDILNLSNLTTLLTGTEILFHLAAVHGGRGFIDRNESECSRNFAIDNLIIECSYQAGVKKMVFASSGCVYPIGIQQDTRIDIKLKEELVSPPYDPDNIYGWTKLMAELTLKAYYREKQLKSACCRFFTAYGPYANESHAIMALIARSYLKQDPFEIWGDGSQIRNWTYIRDIVEGLIAAAAIIEDSTAVNIGSDVGLSLIETARIINGIFKHQPKYKFLDEKPSGPMNRVADVSMSNQLLGTSLKTPFSLGISETIDWYTKSKSKNEANVLLKLNS